MAQNLEFWDLTELLNASTYQNHVGNKIFHFLNFLSSFLLHRERTISIGWSRNSKIIGSPICWNSKKIFKNVKFDSYKILVCILNWATRVDRFGTLILSDQCQVSAPWQDKNREKITSLEKPFFLLHAFRMHIHCWMNTKDGPYN